MGIYFESFFTDLVLASVTLITVIIVYFKYNYQHWTRQNIVQLEPELLFGNCKDIILQRVPISIGFQNIYNTFKSQNVPFGGFYYINIPELMILDPDLIKNILVRDFNHFPGKGGFIDEENDPLSAHLFSIEGQKWKILRQKLSPTFTSGKMKMMFSTLLACSDEMNNVLRENLMSNAAIDIKDILARFTTDVIGSCAFGVECNSFKDPNADFLKYGQKCFSPKNTIDKIKQNLARVLPNVFKFFKIPSFQNDVTNFFVSIVKETVKYREESNISKKDFLQLLIQLKNIETDDSEKNLTIKEIAAQCFVFFLAGFDTSSTMMTFCLYELVNNLEIQEKLREEINTVLKKYDDKLCYDAITEMHYMEKVIYETLRKYPPLAFLERHCAKDYPIPNSNSIIRKGDHIRISLLGLHKDPEYYPDPEKFDPERFSEEQRSARPPYTFLPFGEGPKICIGIRFGMMVTKVGLTVLLKNYTFTLNQKTPDPLIMDSTNLFLSAAGGIWLNVKQITP